MECPKHPMIWTPFFGQFYVPKNAVQKMLFLISSFGHKKHAQKKHTKKHTQKKHTKKTHKKKTQKKNSLLSSQSFQIPSPKYP